MTDYDVKRFALALAIQADIEGMKALNTYRESRRETIAYDENCFFNKAEELRELAYKHDEQL